MVRAKWEQLLSADDELRAAVPPARRLPLRRRRPAVAPAAATAAPAPDDALPAPPLPPHHNRRVLHHLLAGALAGATAKTVEAPLDRVKIIFQVSNKRFTLRAAARQLVAIAQSEGVAGLWKGNGAMMARVVPYAAINYAAHETLSRWLTPAGAEHRSPLRKFAAGALTGMTSTICTYPIDVARARMAVAPRGVANTLFAAFGDMWRDPRRGGAFYAGLTPTLAGIIPYSGTTWATYETLKERLLARRGQPASGELSAGANALLGGFAGIAGQTVSYPCDVVRRRMQTAVLAAGAARAPGVAAVFLELARTEGLRGLYKGLSVNFVKAPLAMGISFSMFASVKQLLEGASASAAGRRLQEQQLEAAAEGGAAGAGEEGARPPAPAARAAAAAAAAAAAPGRAWWGRRGDGGAGVAAAAAALADEAAGGALAAAAHADGGGGGEPGGLWGRATRRVAAGGPAAAPAPAASAQPAAAGARR